VRKRSFKKVAQRRRRYNQLKQSVFLQVFMYG